LFDTDHTGNGSNKRSCKVTNFVVRIKLKNQIIAEKLLNNLESMSWLKHLVDISYSWRKDWCHSPRSSSRWLDTCWAVNVQTTIFQHKLWIIINYASSS